MLEGINLGYSVAGAFVSFLVGLTGVGGGSLMSPILILLFGINPAVAIGTDLWFAAITKTAGGAIHHRLGSVDWALVRRLAAGSLPVALLTLAWLWLIKGGSLESDFLMRLLGFALLLTAVLMILKPRIQPALRKLKHRIGPGLRNRQLVITVLAGGVIGGLVTLTSVGAGALVAVVLAMIYPLRLTTKDIVGTDIMHAVPLTLVAATGHSFLGNVDGWLLASLLIGSIPGIIAGSLVGGRVNENVVRHALAAMLAASSFKLLLT